jgi:hypothetical protein
MKNRVLLLAFAFAAVAHAFHHPFAKVNLKDSLRLSMPSTSNLNFLVFIPLQKHQRTLFEPIPYKCSSQQEFLSAAEDSGNEDSDAKTFNLLRYYGYVDLCILFSLSVSH